MRLLELKVAPIEFIPPNFEYEFNEVKFQQEVYNYFKKSKKNWLALTAHGKPTAVTFSKVDQFENHDHDLDNLDDEKLERVKQQFMAGKVEMPIVLHDKEANLYHLLSGNTRLAWARKNRIKPTVWMVETPELLDYF